MIKNNLFLSKFYKIFFNKNYILLKNVVKSAFEVIEYL